MTESNGAQEASTLVLRISVPVAGGYLAIVQDLAVRVAAFAGEPDAGAATTLLDALARRVAPRDGIGRHEDMTVEFHRMGDELVLHASCDGRSADARHPLPSEPAG